VVGLALWVRCRLAILRVAARSTGGSTRNLGFPVEGWVTVMGRVSGDPRNMCMSKTRRVGPCIGIRSVMEVYGVTKQAQILVGAPVPTSCTARLSSAFASFRMSFAVVLGLRAVKDSFSVLVADDTHPLAEEVLAGGVRFELKGRPLPT